MGDTYTVVGSGANAKYTITKAPKAVLDYPFDWSAWLSSIDDTIIDHLIIVDDGIVCTSSVLSGNIVVAWISGGTEGTIYRVTCRITTAGGRVDERSIFIKVK